MDPWSRFFWKWRKSWLELGSSFSSIVTAQPINDSSLGGERVSTHASQTISSAWTPATRSPNLIQPWFCLSVRPCRLTTQLSSSCVNCPLQVTTGFTRASDWSAISSVLSISSLPSSGSHDYWFFFLLSLFQRPQCECYTDQGLEEGILPGCATLQGVPSFRSGSSLNLVLFSFMEASLHTCDWHRDTQGRTLVGGGLQRSGEA